MFNKFRLPPRITFFAVSAVVVASIVFYFIHKEKLMGTAEVFKDTEQSKAEGIGREGTKESTGDEDFGGGIIGIGNESNVMNLTFGGEFSYDRDKKRLQIDKTFTDAIVSQTDDDGAMEYHFVYRGKAEDWQDQFLIFDGGMQTVTVHAQRQTITVCTDRVSAFTITEDENYIYMQTLDIKEKYNQIVLIDPGHGGVDEGAIVDGVEEKTLNFGIASKLYELFENNPGCGVKAYMTRYGDTGLKLSKRPEMANKICDLYVSIHCNTYDTSTPSGLITFFDSDRDASLSRIDITNKQLAFIMQEKLLDKLGCRDRGLEVTHELVVLNRSSVPSVLIETGYMTNPGELENLQSEDYQQKAAQGIYEGILEVFSIG